MFSILLRLLLFSVLLKNDILIWINNRKILQINKDKSFSKLVDNIYVYLKFILINISVTFNHVFILQYNM